jgi:hypothetical protein
VFEHQSDKTLKGTYWKKSFFNAYYNLASRQNMGKLSVSRFFSYIAGVYIYQFVYIFVMLAGIGQVLFENKWHVLPRTFTVYLGKKLKFSDLRFTTGRA